MRTNRIWTALLGVQMLLDPSVGVAAGKTRHQTTGIPAVIVYVRQSNDAVPNLRRAEAIATSIFASIDLSVEFRAGAAQKPAAGVAIEIQLDFQTRPSFHPEALAYATPFADSGTRIHVFCDRILKAGVDAGTGSILAHVMVHEIGHVLEGVDRHSADGVMKARFEIRDFRQMLSERLTFDPADVELIRAGLNKLAVADGAHNVGR